MRKILLCISIFLISAFQLTADAYETVIIKYPPEQLWSKSFYKKVGDCDSTVGASDELSTDK